MTPQTAQAISEHGLWRAFLKASMMLAIALCAIVATPSHAKDPIYTSLFSDKAAGGYDVVSYFQDNGPQEGSSEFSLEYKDATWLFTSQENLALFKADPSKYAPQYGGYCAFAVGNGYTAKADPLQWSIKNDKLYLNYNKSVKQDWLADVDNFIVSGDKNWPSVLD